MSNAVLNKQIATFEPQGYVSAANAIEFQEQLISAVRKSDRPILLVDMAKVEFIDSAGLMSLIKGFRLAQSLEKRLVICSVAPSVRMIFELTQLDKVFEILENRNSLDLLLKD